MKEKTRRHFLKSATAIAAGASVFMSGGLSGRPASAGNNKRPNIVLIVSDDHGLDALGIFPELLCDFKCELVAVYRFAAGEVIYASAAQLDYAGDAFGQVIRQSRGSDLIIHYGKIAVLCQFGTYEIHEVRADSRSYTVKYLGSGDSIL